MKSKAIPGRTGTASSRGELIFTWKKGEWSTVRLWLAVALAAVIFGGVWALTRIVVPQSFSADRLTADKAQLLLIGPQSEDALADLMFGQRLPSLTLDDAVGSSPLVGDLLQQLGLQEEVTREFTLFPAPELKSTLRWPEKEKSAALALPPLSKPTDQAWPQWGAADSSAWQLEIEGGPFGSDEQPALSIPWSGALPLDKVSLWSLVVDGQGELILASATEDLDQKVEKEVRKQLQQAFVANERDWQSFAGVVKLNFRKANP